MPVSIQPAELPDSGTLRFKLSEINNLHIDNYRTTVDDDELDDLRDSISQGTDHKSGVCGVKQSILGCWDSTKTKALLSGGFRRYECCLQVALKKIVDEFNESFAYEKDNPKFIHLNGNPFGKKAAPSTVDRQKHREQIREQGGEWQAKYDAALAHYSVELKLEDSYGDPDTEDGKAMMHADNLLSNDTCVAPSFYDKMRLVNKLQAAGTKSNIISRKMKVSAPVVSTLTKIYNLGDAMRLRFSGKELDAAYPNPEDKTKALATLEVGLAEMIRRMKLSPKDDDVIEISKAKTVANALDNDKEPIKLPDCIDLLSLLTRLTPDGKPTNHSTPDLSTLESNIRAKKALAKAPVITDAPLVTAPTPATVASNLTDSVNEAMAILTSSPPTPVVVPPAPVTKPVEAPLPANDTLTGDKAIEAQIAAENRLANADVPPMEAMAGMPVMGEEMNLEDIINAGGIDEAEANDALKAAAATAPAAAQPTGEMRTKTTEATVERYKITPPEAIERRAADQVNSVATFEGASVFEIAQALGAANELFSIIGLRKQEQIVNKATIAYVDQAGKWLNALTAFVDAMADESTKAEIAKLKPTYVAPSLTA